MRVLAIDSAAASCAACVTGNGTVLAMVEEKMERGQDRRLIPVILEAMRQADMTFDALDRVGVSRGPGSFTGLRIGLAAARGIGLAAGKPVIGIDRFAIYRRQFAAAEKLLVVIQSRRAELFCRRYSADAPDAPMMLRSDAIDMIRAQNPGLTLCGDVPELTGLHSGIEPETLTCAALAATADPKDAANLPRPLYIRPPDVTLAAVAAARS